MTSLNARSLASHIDHTLLQPQASKIAVEELCREAVHFGFASVCVFPSHLAVCAPLLKDSGVNLGTVAGFPTGAGLTSSKAFEVRRAVELGAQEVDMVIHVGALLDGEDAYVEKDIRNVVEAAGRGVTVKVILETCLLTEEAIARGCGLVRDAGAHYVKTSTGFSTGGATVEHVSLMKQTVGDVLGVKAAGGIRSLDQALALIEAGADRLGTSAGVSLMNEALGGGRS